MICTKCGRDQPISRFATPEECKDCWDVVYVARSTEWLNMKQLRKAYRTCGYCNKSLPRSWWHLVPVTPMAFGSRSAWRHEYPVILCNYEALCDTCHAAWEEEEQELCSRKVIARLPRTWPNGLPTLRWVTT